MTRYLDVAALPHHVRTAEEYNFHVNKVHLHDGEAAIGRGQRFILNAFSNRSCSAVLFINSTVTSIILHSRGCYFFDLHDIDSRGPSIADRLLVLFNFANFLYLENYIQFAHLKYQGRKRQYFQLQFVKIEVADVLIDRNIRFMPSKKNVRNNGLKPKKVYSNFEKIGTPI